jgi:uncharacterized membrane protein
VARGTNVPARSRARPWDLYIALVYTLVVSAAILLTARGNLWAALLLLFFPGYVAVAALFPGQGYTARLRRLAEEGEELRTTALGMGLKLESYRADVAQANQAAATGRLTQAVRLLREANDRLRDRIQLNIQIQGARVRVRPPRDERAGGAAAGIDWVERISLSFGLSVAIVSLIGLLLGVSPFGIRLETIVLSLLLFTVLVGLLAHRRRMGLPPEDRLSIAIGGAPPAVPTYTALDRLLVIGLAGSILFAAGVVTYVAVTPRPVEHFTQLYLLDANGTADPEQFPTNLTVDEPGAVTVVAISNESGSVAYTLGIDLVGIERVFNTTSGSNETIELNRTTLDTFNFSLDPGGHWQQLYNFSIDRPGLWRLDFLLSGDHMSPPQPKRAYFDIRVTVAP